MATRSKSPPPLHNSARETRVKLELERLRQLVPLDNMSRNSLRHVINHTQLILANQGDILFDLGETKPYTFFLLRGTLILKDSELIAYVAKKTAGLLLQESKAAANQ